MPEEYLDGLTSAYLHRGRLRLNAYGICATGNRVIGFKIPMRIFVISIFMSIVLSTIVILFSGRNLILAVSLSDLSPFERFLGEIAGPLILLSLTPIFLSSYIAEKVMRRHDVREMMAAMTRKDFEVEKGDIEQIEVQRKKDGRSWHLLIRLRSGQPIEVRIGGFSGRSGETLVRVMQLVDKFWGKGPDIRSSNYEVWR